MTPRAYRGRLLTVVDGAAPAARFWDDALLVVEGGRVASAGPYAPRAFAGPVLDLRPGVIVPGFVDAHVHFPQTRVIGRAGAPLLEWLERDVFPEEARFRDLAYARVVADEFVARLAAAGTTTAAIFGSSGEVATDALFEALATSGLRAIAGPTLMDQRCPEALAVPADEALAACARLADRWHRHDEGRLRFALAPRFALSCSRELMERAARFADDRRLVVQTHVAESVAEGAAVLEAHPFARDYLGVYEAVGLVGPRTILAHAVHLGPDGWDRVAARGAAVAHCPDSNFFLGSGVMRLAAARARGVRVGLGSDVAAGRSFDMRRAVACAHDAALLHGDRFDAVRLLHHATLGGARALGLGDVAGSLEAGKEADFVVLDLPAPAEDEGTVLALVAFADGVRVRHAYVRGRQVFARPNHER